MGVNDEMDPTKSVSIEFSILNGGYQYSESESDQTDPSSTLRNWWPTCVDGTWLGRSDKERGAREISENSSFKADRGVAMA